jgi:outer membrane protein OmpA-like peptidoglycan-associated protein
MNALHSISRLLPFCMLFACATAAPPQELIGARDAYQHAQQGPAATLTPAELHIAEESLDVAERSFKAHPESQDTVDNAYIAMRKAERANALGIAAAAIADRDRANRDAGRTTQEMLSDKDARLKDTQGALAHEHDALNHERESLARQKEATAAERDARLAAEQKAHDAMDALAKSLEVKSEERGMVITLSGGVVFATNQAVILPGAQAQLDQVAEALKTQAEHHFTVEGHTDNQGTDRINDDLSSRRANSVRDYLIVHGVAAAAITAQGYGSKRPVADNKNPEGRAMNRRVEIIVDKGTSPVSTR